MTKGSKKIIAVLFAFWLLFGISYSLQNTQAANSLVDLFSARVENITTTGITNTEVTIEFPTLVANGESIKNYDINYTEGKAIGEAFVEDMRKSSFNADSVDFKEENGNTYLTMRGLKPSTQYYFVVVPINKEGNVLVTSDQHSFITLADPTVTEPTTTVEPVLGAATLDAANFTNTVSGNSVTIKWNTISDVNKFRFATKETTKGEYKDVATESVTKETMTLIMEGIGMYNIKITPLDSSNNVIGEDKVLTVKIETITQTPGKGTPATGPMANMILMSTFLLMLIYVVYRFRTTK